MMRSLWHGACALYRRATDLALQLKHEAEDAVGGRVLRPKVDGQVLQLLLRCVLCPGRKEGGGVEPRAMEKGERGEGCR